MQLVTIVSGFIIPKIILSNFGSEVNGLVSSITQFLNYISILEGGVGSVIMAALYKPILERDEVKISGIVNATQLFFRKIALFYSAYLVVVAFVYPLFVKTDYSYGYVVGLCFVLAINLFVQYFFSISYRLLLNADRRVYFVNFLQGTIVILNVFAVVICARLFKDILILKLASSTVFCIIPVAYSLYVKKHYALDRKVEPDSKTLSQRWDGFGINLAFFIHTNTDIVILTIFTTLSSVSVYSVYLMIVNALKGLTISLSGAITPSFGKVIAKGDVESANKAFDLYQLGMFIVTTIMFSCGIVLVTPFVDVYTSNIFDANYHQPVFGAVIMIAEMIYCLRDPLVAVSYTSGNFKSVSKYAYIEAIINIVVSLSLVWRYGLVGIAIGTAIAMLYRMIMQAVFASKEVLHRPIRKFFKEIVVYGVTIAIICMVSNLLFVVQCKTYFDWIIVALKTGCFTVIITLVVSVVFFNTDFRQLLKRLNIKCK